MGGDGMRRSKSFKIARMLSVLAACAAGYAIVGGWQPAALRASNELSAAQSVALRFPQAWDTAPPVASVAEAPPVAGVLDASLTTSADETDEIERTLLSPEPMVPPAINARAAPHLAAQQPPDTLSESSGHGDATADAVSSGISVTSEAPDSTSHKSPKSLPTRMSAVQPVRVARAIPVAVRRHPIDNRPGYVLDDAQIASIKERLHLTPDQQAMWPAVEAALRNIAYKRAQDARRRDGLSNAQAAAVDPEAVEGLKSAAVPLIMSFNDDQKQQVRDIAHVMGLDQLAAQF
jgi:hypothetical protein